MISPVAELDLRIEKAGIESRLSGTGTFWEFGAKSGPGYGSESIVSRHCEAEGVAGACRGSGCVDYLDYSC